MADFRIFFSLMRYFNLCKVSAICGKRRFKRWWDASAAKGSTGHGEAVGAVPHARPQDEGGGLAEA
jgi:hypothetical protein